MNARNELHDLAVEHYDLDPEYLQKRLARLAPTVDVVIRYRLYLELIELIELRDLLYPDTDMIPGGYESRAEADIQVENYDTEIELILSQLVPNETALAAAS